MLGALCSLSIIDSLTAFITLRDVIISIKDYSQAALTSILITVNAVFS